MLLNWRVLSVLLLYISKRVKRYFEMVVRANRKLLARQARLPPVGHGMMEIQINKNSVLTLNVELYHDLCDWLFNDMPLSGTVQTVCPREILRCPGYDLLRYKGNHHLFGNVGFLNHAASEFQCTLVLDARSRCRDILWNTGSATHIDMREVREKLFKMTCLERGLLSHGTYGEEKREIRPSNADSLPAMEMMWTVLEAEWSRLTLPFKAALITTCFNPLHLQSYKNYPQGDSWKQSHLWNMPLGSRVSTRIAEMAIDETLELDQLQACIGKWGEEGRRRYLEDCGSEY